MDQNKKHDHATWTKMDQQWTKMASHLSYSTLFSRLFMAVHPNQRTNERNKRQEFDVFYRQARSTGSQSF